MLRNENRSQGYLRDWIRGAWKRGLEIKCVVRMKDGSWCRIEVCRKKERKERLATGDQQTSVVWYLGCTR
jgi:hypothetical protein